ncbi:MAG: tail fiber domain-containing protein, partial [Flavobacteriia bacterium]|nr:tail fiber domain-containing protein [Flavobacteriia bacterium]
MKKLILSAFVGINLFASSQTPPTGTAPNGNITPPSLPATINQAERAWYRGGNNSTGAASTNNIFGTMWNSPIYTFTAGTRRMKLNGDVSYDVNGYNQTRNGHLLIGNDGNSLTGSGLIYETKGAFSLLHLNGPGDFVQELGYRNWMKTGITLTGNNDLSYFGLRQLGSSYDVSETVVSWSDNNTSSNITDEMCFRFMGATQGGTTNIESTTLSADDLDGLHIARYTPEGRFGLGSVFGNTDVVSPANYITPQSLQHMSYPHRFGAQFEPYGFSQITYRYNGLGGGETTNDGLRIGIDNDQYVGNGLHGFLRWQEQTPFIIQTDWNNTPGDIEQGERMRISSTGAPNVTNGVYNTGDNVTRVSIPYEGTPPISNPRALVHLGKDVQSGYDASFMDYGTLTNDGNQSLFTGITPSSYVANPQQNVIGFQAANLVFVNGGDMEVGRFQESNNNFGIGNFSTTHTMNCFSAPSERLDVEGNARLREVPYDETAEYIMLGKKQCNDNEDDIAFRKLALPNNPNVFLNGEGDWISSSETTSLIFALCSNPSNTASQLTDNSKLYMNNKNLFFNTPLNQDQFTNYIGFGYDCSEMLKGKISARLDHQYSTGNTIAGYFENVELLSSQNTGTQTLTGVKSVVNTIQTNNSTSRHLGVGIDVSGSFKNYGLESNVNGLNIAKNNYGANITASGAVDKNYAINGIARFGTTTFGSYLLAYNGQNNYGYYGEAFNGNMNYGGFFKAYNGTNNIAVSGIASTDMNYPLPNSANYSIGGYFSSFGGSGQNYGVYSIAAVFPNSYSGYFKGRVHVTGTISQGSDILFKTDIVEEKNALEMISKLKPITFKYKTNDFPNFGFDTEIQHGFIAQEVESILPELVKDVNDLGERDSLGNSLFPVTYYKSLNYNGLISINTQAINELNQKVDRQTLSDENLKINVEEISNSLNKVLEMRGVSYSWDLVNHPELLLDSTEHIGFIAQEINQIDSRLTFTDNNDFMHVDYDKIVPILAESIQE